MFARIIGFLSFIAIIITGILMPKTYPSLQILLGGIGFLCLFFGEILDVAKYDKRTEKDEEEKH